MASEVAVEVLYGDLIPLNDIIGCREDHINHSLLWHHHPEELQHVHLLDF